MLYLSSFLWGILEATFFFVAPDIALSFYAIKKNFAYAVAHAVFAAFGAMFGVFLLYSLASGNPLQIRYLLDLIPAISPELINFATTKMEHSNWINTALISSFSPIPLKLFVYGAAINNIPIYQLIAASSLMCFPRYFAIILISRAAKNYIYTKTKKPKVLYTIWALFWILFYGIYWLIMPN